MRRPSRLFPSDAMKSCFSNVTNLLRSQCSPKTGRSFAMKTELFNTSTHRPNRAIHSALLFIVAALFAALPAKAQVSLVSTGALWFYNDTGTDLGTDWRGTNYDDTMWTTGH